MWCHTVFGARFTLLFSPELVVSGAFGGNGGGGSGVGDCDFERCMLVEGPVCKECLLCYT